MRPVQKGEEGGKGGENKNQQGGEARAASREQRRTRPCQEAVMAPAHLLEAVALICIWSHLCSLIMDPEP